MKEERAHKDPGDPLYVPAAVEAAYLEQARRAVAAADRPASFRRVPAMNLVSSRVSLRATVVGSGPGRTQSGTRRRSGAGS